MERRAGARRRDRLSGGPDQNISGLSGDGRSRSQKPGARNFGGGARLRPSSVIPPRETWRIRIILLARTPKHLLGLNALDEGAAAGVGKSEAPFVQPLMETHTYRDTRTTDSPVRVSIANETSLP
ncbi:hypothetical protein KM043_003798 [Ampulex compressa]|nr:hypothetical protein KM043_003798 [Ampulex compressa]